MDTQPSQTPNAEVKTETMEPPKPVTTIPFTPPQKTEVIEEKKPPEPKPEMDTKLPFEQRIVAFLENRKTGDFIKLNDFLKFLYPQPEKNAPPLWMNQSTSKSLKVLLDKMQTAGKIIISNNQHRRLGTFFYSDSPVTQYYNIGNLIIEAKSA